MRNDSNSGSPTTVQRVISGRGVANLHSDKRQLACLAADWVTGSVEVRPSIRQAAALFGVSATYVNKALKLADHKRAAIEDGRDHTSFEVIGRPLALPKPNGNGSTVMTDDELGTIAKAVGPDRMLAAAITADLAR
jgi:hypothetical protein